MTFQRGDDLAVRVSQYTQDGQLKYRYKTIGRVLVSPDGREMITIDRTFNPAGVLSDGRDAVILYRFQPRDAASRQPLNQEQLDDIPF